MVYLNLLDVLLQKRLIVNPSLLEELIDGQLSKNSEEVIIIDEIQKIPALLDEVHRLIEERKFKFLLTGSSARKLKAHGEIANLYPLTSHEIGSLDLDRYLRYGGLPHVYLSEYPQEDLNSYVATYINEEIKQEGLVKKIPAFTEFLGCAAKTNGQLLNFAKIASDLGVSAPTVKEYYSILEDTLLGLILEPWQKSKKRKAISTGRFYFFDIGVVHTLNEVISLDRKSDLYGNSFEHFIFMELRAYLSYRRSNHKLRFWRSESKYEVDFIVGDHTAIEVKTTTKVDERDQKGLRALKEEKMIKSYLLVTQDRIETEKDGIRCLPWQKFLKQLWNDELF
jgi:predicted AAA+ superfamily ATPase